MLGASPYVLWVDDRIVVVEFFYSFIDYCINLILVVD
jgi:hypothetical protein